MFGRKKKAISPVIQAVIDKLRDEPQRWRRKGYDEFVDKDTGFRIQLQYRIDTVRDRYYVNAPVPLSKAEARALECVLLQMQRRYFDRIRRVRAWQEARKVRRFEKAYGVTK